MENKLKTRYEPSPEKENIDNNKVRTTTIF